MATFKVGQRVKWIATAPHWFNPVPIGTTGTIAPQHSLALPTEVTVLCDGPLPDGGCLLRYAFPWELAPLTDPKADEFIERIKNMKPYEEPIRQPEKVA